VSFATVLLGVCIFAPQSIADVAAMLWKVACRTLLEIADDHLRRRGGGYQIGSTIVTRADGDLVGATPLHHGGKMGEDADVVNRWVWNNCELSALGAESTPAALSIPQLCGYVWRLLIVGARSVRWWSPEVCLLHWPTSN